MTANLPDHPAPRPDDDPLLRSRLDVDIGTHQDRVAGLLEFLDLGREGVGQLVFQELEGGFPQVLGRKEAQRLGSDLVLGKGEFAFRQAIPDRFQKAVNSLPRFRGNDQPGPLQALPLGGYQVSLGIGPEDRLPGESGHFLGVARIVGRQEMEHQIGPLQSFLGKGPHSFLHGIGGIEQAGQIVKDVLDPLLGPETHYRQPGGLRLGAYQGQVLPDQGVQQR